MSIPSVELPSLETGRRLLFPTLLESTALGKMAATAPASTCFYLPQIGCVMVSVSTCLLVAQYRLLTPAQVTPSSHTVTMEKRINIQVGLGRSPGGLAPGST